MATEETIECPSCQRAVIPRLWFTGGDYMSYMKTQHICPLCGIVMYETGGGYKRGAVIATIVGVPLILFALILVLMFTIRN
jgi:ribosomal protein S27E